MFKINLSSKSNNLNSLCMRAAVTSLNFPSGINKVFWFWCIAIVAPSGVIFTSEFTRTLFSWQVVKRIQAIKLMLAYQWRIDGVQKLLGSVFWDSDEFRSFLCQLCEHLRRLLRRKKLKHLEQFLVHTHTHTHIDRVQYRVMKTV